MRSLITRFVIGCIVCVFIVGGITPKTAAAAPAPALPSDSLMNTQQMCSSSPVPAGWVVTYATSQAASLCGPFLFYTITPLSGSTMQICSATPVPAGWVVTYAASSPTCGSFLYYQIRRI